MPTFLPEQVLLSFSLFPLPRVFRLVERHEAKEAPPTVEERADEWLVLDTTVCLGTRTGVAITEQIRGIERCSGNNLTMNYGGNCITFHSFGCSSPFVIHTSRSLFTKKVVRSVDVASSECHIYLTECPEYFVKWWKWWWGREGTSKFEDCQEFHQVTETEISVAGQQHRR